MRTARLESLKSEDLNSKVKDYCLHFVLVDVLSSQ